MLVDQILGIMRGQPIPGRDTRAASSSSRVTLRHWPAEWQASSGMARHRTPSDLVVKTRSGNAQ